MEEFFMFLRSLWLLVLSLTSFLFADEEDNGVYQFLNQELQPPSLVNMTAMPSAIVNGVNVITGDYVEYDQEYSVSGPDPYALGHVYLSSSVEKGTIGNGWNFLHQHLFQTFQPNKIMYTKEVPQREAKRDHPRPTSPQPPRHVPLYAFLVEPYGGRLTFEGRAYGQKQPHLRHFRMRSKNTGFTNVSGNILSGQTNIKNTRTSWDKEKDRWYVLLGDGTKRIYGRQWKRYEMIHSKPRHATYYRDYHLLGDKLIESQSQIISSSNSVLRWETKVPVSQKSAPNLSHFEEKISDWLGEEVKTIVNKAGDPIFISKNGTRRIRFDFNRPNPHQNPHMHLEEKIGNEWEGPRIYPKDVPNN